MKRVVSAASLLWAAFACAEAVKPGAWRTFDYETPDRAPIVFGGWCRCENASARDCCVWLDVIFDNGEAAWGRKAEFAQGTHDWQEARAVYVPPRPVKQIRAHALFRGRGGWKARGRAEFRDLWLERREGRNERFHVSTLTDRPFSDADEIQVDVFDGGAVRREKTLVPSASPPSSPVAPGTVRVWTEDSMRRVTPLTFPAPDAKSSVAVSLAKRERESAQILLSSAADVEWTAATLELTALKRADGAAFRGEATWSRQGYLARTPGANPHPFAFPANEKWFPDPLLPPAPMRVRRASTQGAWLTFHAFAAAEAGVYRGEAIVRERGEEKARVPIEVTVEPFALPATFGLKTAYAMMDSFIRRAYPEDFEKRKREAWDLMLDHRLNPDDITRWTPPSVDDLVYARGRGMNSFNVVNVVPPPKDPNAQWQLYVKDPKEIFSDSFYSHFLGVVRPFVAELRERGLDGLAYVYGFDEREKEFYPGMEEFCRKLRRDVPGLPVMTTARNYRDFADGLTNLPGVTACDWLCPSVTTYDPALSDRLRAQGKRVWWYTSLGPGYPYANFAGWEHPIMDGRLLGWMTWQSRADGFLFWIVNKWRDGMRAHFKEDDVYFPGYSTFNPNGVHGDGVLTFPGEKHVLPSIRLAQCRDAEEDYEYLRLAAASAGTNAADEIVSGVVWSLTDFTRSPAELRAARRRLADTVARGAQRRVPAADRSAFVDAQGVMRWLDDGDEVAVFGVNYYTPFHVEFRETKARGYDAKDVIRKDVAHLRRLGLDAVRLHCFDSEISDRSGGLVDNEHLDLLDFLIAECASNGMYTVLTPIAGWGGCDPCRTNGFWWGRSRADLASDPALVAAQVRYEEEFARHVNRYTGRRYADDPAVLAFELANEPAYPKGWTDAQVAGYANALLAGIRKSGTAKPVFYNALWGTARLGAVPLLKTDGVSGGAYPTGLRAGMAHETPQLHVVRDGQFKPDPRLAGKAKIVYEFDAADVVGAYMYPAMARLFRSHGVQSATQFQYESTPIADDNLDYMTHYLHLVYTPEKAISLAIAAEAFRRLPRGAEFAPADRAMSFPPFGVDVARNLSEMVTETELLYTSAPATPPPAPEKLRRVWGCGASSVAASSGNGCYFLDRVADGLWRLQIYPSVLPCADPHTGTPGVKTAVLADPPTFTSKLPDLGDSFACVRTSDGARIGSARNGEIALAPGDYVLAREPSPSAERLALARAFDLPVYWAPPPHPADPKRRRWPPTREERLAAERARADAPGKWNFINSPEAWRRRLGVKNFLGENTQTRRFGVAGWAFAEIFPKEKCGVPQTLVVRGRSTSGRPEPVEITLRTGDDRPWGTVVTFAPEGGEVRVPVSSLKYMAHHRNAAPFDPARPFVFGEVVHVAFCIGRWLYPKEIGLAHGVEIEFVGAGDFVK